MRAATFPADGTGADRAAAACIAVASVGIACGTAGCATAGAAEAGPGTSAPGVITHRDAAIPRIVSGTAAVVNVGKGPTSAAANKPPSPAPNSPARL